MTGHGVAATVIAIDGPAGAGKSTVARALARHLGVPHVDTGAYYRAATLAVLRAGVDPSDEAATVAVVRTLDIRRRDDRTLLNGDDVEAEIRDTTVTVNVSAVSAHQSVRAVLLDLQRRDVGSQGAVVEGRDAGTVVVPAADLKVWLTAAPQVRAARRAAQRGESGDEVIAAHVADITRRDAMDAAQMARAADVVEVDTTDRTIEQVVDAIVVMALAGERS